jgi:hypothetical protein
LIKYGLTRQCNPAYPAYPGLVDQLRVAASERFDKGALKGGQGCRPSRGGSTGEDGAHDH